MSRARSFSQNRDGGANFGGFNGRKQGTAPGGGASGGGGQGGNQYRNIGNGGQQKKPIGPNAKRGGKELCIASWESDSDIAKSNCYDPPSFSNLSILGNNAGYSIGPKGPPRGPKPVSNANVPINFQVSERMKYSRVFDVPYEKELDSDDRPNVRLEGGDAQYIRLKPRTTYQVACNALRQINVNDSNLEMNFHFNGTLVQGLHFSLKMDTLKFAWRCGGLIDVSDKWYKFGMSGFVTAHFAMAEDGTMCFINSLKTEYETWLQAADSMNLALEDSKSTWRIKPNEKELADGIKQLVVLTHYHKSTMRWAGPSEHALKLWKDESCLYDNEWRVFHMENRRSHRINARVKILLDEKAFTMSNEVYDRTVQDRLNAEKRVRTFPPVRVRQLAEYNISGTRIISKNAESAKKSVPVDTSMIEDLTAKVVSKAKQAIKKDASVVTAQTGIHAKLAAAMEMRMKRSKARDERITEGEKNQHNMAVQINTNFAKHSTMIKTLVSNQGKVNEWAKLQGAPVEGELLSTAQEAFSHHCDTLPLPYRAQFENESDITMLDETSEVAQETKLCNAYMDDVKQWTAKPSTSLVNDAEAGRTERAMGFNRRPSESQIRTPNAKKRSWADLVTDRGNKAKRTNRSYTYIDGDGNMVNDKLFYAGTTASQAQAEFNTKTKAVLGGNKHLYWTGGIAYFSAEFVVELQTRLDHIRSGHVYEDVNEPTIEDYLERMKYFNVGINDTRFYNEGRENGARSFGCILVPCEHGIVYTWLNEIITKRDPSIDARQNRIQKVTMREFGSYIDRIHSPVSESENDDVDESNTSTLVENSYQCENSNTDFLVKPLSPQPVKGHMEGHQCSSNISNEKVRTKSNTVTDFYDNVYGDCNLTNIFSNNDQIISPTKKPVKLSQQNQLHIDISTASLMDIKQWFLAQNIPKVTIGQKHFWVNSINDLDSMKLLYQLYDSNLVNSSMYFHTAIGTQCPEVQTVLNESFDIKKSKWHNYISKYPISNANTETTTTYTTPTYTATHKLCNNNEQRNNKKTFFPMHPTLDFLNINLQKASPAKLDILTKNYNEVAFFLLNEIALKISDKELVTPAGYFLYTGPADSVGKCYSAILVKEELKAYIKEFPLSPFFCKILFQHEAFKCFFTSVYRPCDSSKKYGYSNKRRIDFFKELGSIANDKSQFGSIIGGDFNIHFSGPKKNQKRLDMLKKCLKGYKNQIKQCTYRRLSKKTGKLYESCIDAVFTKNVTLSGFIHLNLKDEISTDGHLGQKGIIDYDLNFAQLKNNTFSRVHASNEEIYNNGNLAWPLFLACLEDQSLKHAQKMKQLSCLLERLVDYTEPEVVKTRRVGFFKPILNDKTMAWRNKMNHLRALLKNESDNEYYKLAFYEARKIFHKLSSIDRKTYLCTVNQSITIDYNEFWKVNNKLNKNKTNLTDCPIDTENIAEGFSQLQWKNKISIDDRVFDPNRALKNTTKNNSIFSLRPVVWSGKDKSDSLLHALRNSKSLSRGRSGLSKNFLGKLPPPYIEIMLELVNGSLTTGKFYHFWKVSRVTPIPKKGKDPKSIKGWRPISVGDILGTVTEKIAARQFQNYLEKYNIVYSSQHGFRRNHSCSTAIVELTNHIRLNFSANFQIVLMIDAANAFGSPSHAVCLESLYNFCDKIAFQWFTEFLTDRSFYVQKGDERSVLKSLPPRGWPQGSGCGPVGYSTVFNQCLYNIANKFPEYLTLAYADDLVLHACASTEEALEKDITESFNVMNNELKNIDVGIAEGKSAGFKIGQWSKLDFEIDNEKIASPDELLYLGIRLGKNNGSLIDIEPQLNHIYKKMVAARNKVMTVKSYGTIRQLVTLYNSFAVGYFSHGLDCQPKLSQKWYSKLQCEFCNFMKVICHKTYHEIGRPISTDDLLKPFNLRTLYNTHRYLALNRVNSVFCSGKPEYLFKLLRECLVTNENRPAVRPYSIDDDVNSAADRRKYFYDSKIGYYDVTMILPPHIKNIIDNDNISKSWPYCYLEWFNDLPPEIRCLIGTPFFKSELKSYFNSQCQHPYNEKSKFCKKCKPKVDIEADIFLAEQRLLNRIKHDEHFQISYSSNISMEEIQKVRFLCYHYQSYFYYKKFGRYFNVDYLFKKHGIVIKHYYSEIT